MERMQHVYRGSIVTVLKSVLEETIRCAIDSKTVFGFLKPGRGNCVVTAQCDGMTYQCCLNSIDRVSTFWRVLEQFSDNLRCCTNLFSSVDYRQACNRCHRSKSSSSDVNINNGKSGSTTTGGEYRPSDSKMSEKSMRRDYEMSSTSSLYDRESSREEHEYQQRRDFHAASPRQETPGGQHHEMLRRDISRQDSLSQEMLRHTLRQDSIASSTSRQDSMSQENMRTELTRSDSMATGSSYEALRQESYSSEGSKDEVFHCREESKDLYRNNSNSNIATINSPTTSPTAENNLKHEVERGDTPVDVTGSGGASPPEKKRRVERNEVCGVEIVTAPKV